MADTKTKGGGEQTLTVALRIRPLNEDETMMGASTIAHKVQKKMVVLMDPMDTEHDDVLRANRSREKKFVFDYTFDSNASQEEVFKSTASFLIPSVVSGYNATVFAYGATGAGKTYTMLGNNDNPGIMAMSLNVLFQEMERTREDMVYKVSMSYLEIYNEMIRDLLSPSSGILDLREDAKGGVQVAGLSEVTTHTTSEVMEMLLMGNKERTQEPTAANKTSSRSHAVLQVLVKQQNRVRNTSHEVRMGKLFMVDLAGSERAAATHNRGKRMVEGAHINRSLLALGNCINALSDKNGPKYVNFRDSKLTRLLKDALGGNCKTVMIAHISPASLHFEESRNTLIYADRAKHIRTKVRRNVADVSYHIAQYTNIIQELREEINRLRVRLQDTVESGPVSGAKIKTVQAEVLSTQHGEAREQLNKVKEQLLISFKDQMELRKSLMELNNASMEISLETNRNQLIISEWDVEKAKLPRREGGEDMYREDTKTLELAGLGSDDVLEPDEVRMAREELKVLHDEKHRTEKIRGTVQKELDTAKLKTTRLQETIPQRINGEDQREILSLLYKVHVLEIENTEVQSACLLREFQIKKKDMVLSRFRQHQNLTDQIIKRQRVLLAEKNIATPKDLEELYDLYKLELDDRLLLTDEDSGLSPEYLKIGGGGRINRSFIADEGDQLSTLEEEDARLTPRFGEGEKLFSRSAKAQRLRDDNLSVNWGDNLHLNGTPRTPRSPHSSRHNSPQPMAVNLYSDDRTTITSNTRNIAALAAKKRSKAQNNLLNIERQYGEPRSLYRPSNDDAYLSPRTLARHNQSYDDVVLPSIHKPPSEDNLSNATKQSANTDNSNLPPIRGGRKVSKESDLKRNRRTRGYDNSYSSQYAKMNAGRGRHGVDIYGRTKRGQKGDSSGGSTPQSKSKNHVPTITSYRKGDIAVHGFSLPR
ncbi:kinesin-like protein KIF19 [Ylistrum balloti]|uniref:kinesin-like protein KIF19 n=1 Tax=Ylistrum balloti TaxID=509963 RepID=UPI002905BCA0|nr:kinesin-like protein KIF19 [Ylistrum balloti]